MKRSPLPALILLAILLCAFYWETGDVMRILPRYQRRNLLGLTHQQVIDRLGEPSFDPSKSYPFGGHASASWTTTQPEWTSEAESGPLFILYNLRWTTCRIEFHNDRVIDVQIMGK